MTRRAAPQLALPLLDGSPPVHLAAQRWRQGRASFRPPGEVIVPSRYEVARLDDDATAKSFVVAHHYSRSYVAARYRFGLYRGGALVGVAVFSHPLNDRVLTSVFDAPASACVEIGRFVLVDDVEFNGETWFLARCFAALRKLGVVGVVSFSDPVPRTDAVGRVVFPGHVGGIYCAHNAAYLGRATPRILRVLPDGTVFSPRAIQKIRGEERGWHYAARILERHGAEPPAEDLPAWIGTWLPRLTRPLRHAGNHRYAWAVDRRHRGRLVSLPYPRRARA